MEYIEGIEYDEGYIEKIPYINNPGQVIAIIGQATAGPRLEPVYALDKKHVTRKFKHGGLVDAYKAVNKNGGNNIYLVRAEYVTQREKYREYMYAYEILQALDVDIIVPMDFYLTDTIIDYPDKFVKEEAVLLKEDKQEYTLSHDIEEIDYLIYKGSRIKRYELIDDRTIKLTFNPAVEDNSYFTVKYYRIPVLNIDFTIEAYKGNIKQRKYNSTFKFDIREGISQSTDKTIIQHLAENDYNEEYYNDPGWHYQVSIDRDHISAYYRTDGSTPIHFTFNYDEYINSRTKKKYFVEKLAEFCGYLNAVACVKFNQETSFPISEINNIKYILNNKEIQYGRYIVTTPSIIDYGNFTDYGIYALAGLCGQHESHISLTNKPIDSNCAIATQFDDNTRYALSSERFSIFYDTIRNGQVPYTVMTLAEEDNPYRLFKVTRIMNELAKRIIANTDQYVGNESSYALGEINSSVHQVLTEMTAENKIIGGSFEVEPHLQDNEVEIMAYVGLEGELQEVQTTVTAEIFSETDYL